MANDKRDELITSVRSDPSLEEDQKRKLLNLLTDNAFFNKVLYGGFGAAVGAAVANWLKLSRKSKILLAIAGFGIGELLLSASKKSEEKKPLQYNKQTRLYEVQ